MADVTLKAEVRNDFGKGAARRTRAAGRIPAVLYGHGTDPVHLSLPSHETEMAMRLANALLTIEVSGDEDKLALTKQIQRHPVTNHIQHVDLILVRRGEKVEVEVPIAVVGTAAPETIVMTEASALLISAEATHIPAEIEISVEGLEVGSQIFASQVALPAGAELAGDPEELLVVVAAQISEAALEAELETTEADEGSEVSTVAEDEAQQAAAAEEN